MLYDHPLRKVVRDELFEGKDGDSVMMTEEYWARLLKIAIEKARDHEFDTD